MVKFSIYLNRFVTVMKIRLVAVFMELETIDVVFCWKGFVVILSRCRFAALNLINSFGDKFQTTFVVCFIFLTAIDLKEVSM